MKAITVFCGFLLFCNGAPSMAQNSSESTRTLCRNLTIKMAALITKAQQERVDPRTLDNKVLHDSPIGLDVWFADVRDYMFHSASDAPSLTAQELANLGYTNCIERRPTGF
jgi:hypothetical protein